MGHAGIGQDAVPALREAVVDLDLPLGLSDMGDELQGTVDTVPRG